MIRLVWLGTKAGYQISLVKRTEEYTKRLVDGKRVVGKGDRSKEEYRKRGVRRKEKRGV
jgi:hypothetical protein